MSDPRIPAARLPEVSLPGASALSPAVLAPTGRFGRSLAEFWAASRQPASSGTLLACATVGVV
ncbi:MAG TPA: hypothetical protein VF413_08960, partial [Cellulomonas sp.]